MAFLPAIITPYFLLCCLECRCSPSTSIPASVACPPLLHSSHHFPVGAFSPAAAFLAPSPLLVRTRLLVPLLHEPCPLVRRSKLTTSIASCMHPHSFSHFLYRTMSSKFARESTLRLHALPRSIPIPAAMRLRINIVLLWCCCLDPVVISYVLRRQGSKCSTGQLR